jgi:enoyl-CoA hydratase/carnithine racemase
MAVTVERDGPVALVTLEQAGGNERLQHRTAGGTAGRGQRACQADSSVRAVVLTGDGKRAFAAGADISEMSTKSPSRSKAVWRPRARYRHRNWRSATAMDSGHQRLCTWWWMRDGACMRHSRRK